MDCANLVEQFTPSIVATLSIKTTQGGLASIIPDALRVSCIPFFAEHNGDRKRWAKVDSRVVISLRETEDLPRLLDVQRWG